MTLNFYTLGVIYLVYSFLGWVAETVVATIRGGRFANRGAAAGPFCFIYGTTGVLLAVSFGDLRTEPVYLFFACMMAATVMEWITAKLLERLHRRKWWDYSGKKFNLNGYVCLQYSLLWGALGTASVLWGNNVLLRLCAHIPVLAAASGSMGLADGGGAGPDRFGGAGAAVCGPAPDAGAAQPETGGAVGYAAPQDRALH